MDAKWLRNSFLYLIILVALLAIVLTFFNPQGSTKDQPISAVMQKVVDDVHNGHRDDVLTVEGTDVTLQQTYLNKSWTSMLGPNDSLETMLKDRGLTDSDVQLVNKAPSQLGNWLGFITSLLPLLIFGGLLLFMMRQAQGSNNQALSFGKSRARMFTGNRPTVTFHDVAGVEEAKQELAEVVEFLKYPEKFAALGARIPRGVLLDRLAGYW